MSAMNPDREPDVSGNGRDIVSTGRRVVEDATHLRDSTRDFAEVLDERTREVVSEFPYASMLAAAGVGFILGGGLRTRIPAVVLGTSVRLLAGWGIKMLAESARAAQEPEA